MSCDLWHVEKVAFVAGRAFSHFSFHACLQLQQHKLDRSQDQQSGMQLHALWFLTTIFSTFTQHDDDTWYSKFTDQHHINFKHKTVHIYMQVHRSPNSHASSHTKVHGYMQVHTQSGVQIHRYMRITGWTSSFCFLCSLHGYQDRSFCFLCPLQGCQVAA